MKNYIYYVSKFSDGKEVVQRDTYGEKQINYQYKTESSAKEYISSFDSFCRWATKEEWETFCFNKVMPKIKTAFESDDLDYIFRCLSVNDNIFSRKCFEILSGHKLAKQWKNRKIQLIDYYGQKYTDYINKIEQDKQNKLIEQQKEQQQKLNDIEKSFLEYNYISGTEFVMLCDKYNIKLPIKSRGYCLNKLKSIKLTGQYTTSGGKSSGFFDAFFELKNILTKTLDTKKDL